MQAYIYTGTGTGYEAKITQRKTRMMDDVSAVGPNNQLLPLLEALNFAAIKHRDQRRKDASKTPYINHPIGVAHSLATEGGVTDLATLQVETIPP